MPLADNVKEWRLVVIADLVLTVLPVKERAKSWEDVGAAAVYEYERRIDEFHQSDKNFEVNSDSFINKNYICNKRTDIRRLLEQDGNFIGVFAGQGAGEIYRIEKESDLEHLLMGQQNWITGQVESWNERLKTIRRVQPKLASAMRDFEEVKQIGETNGNGDQEIATDTGA